MTSPIDGLTFFSDTGLVDLETRMLNELSPPLGVAGPTDGLLDPPTPQLKDPGLTPPVDALAHSFGVHEFTEHNGVVGGEWTTNGRPIYGTAHVGAPRPALAPFGQHIFTQPFGVDPDDDCGWVDLFEETTTPPLPELKDDVCLAVVPYVPSPVYIWTLLEVLKSLKERVEIQVDFLAVAHTHNDIDRVFSYYNRLGGPGALMMAPTRPPPPPPTVTRITGTQAHLYFAYLQELMNLINNEEINGLR